MNHGLTKGKEAEELSRRWKFRARFPLGYLPSYLLDGLILCLFFTTGTIAAWVPVAWVVVAASVGVRRA